MSTAQWFYVVFTISIAAGTGLVTLIMTISNHAKLSRIERLLSRIARSEPPADGGI